MKKLILGLLAALGIAFSGAESHATTLADNIGIGGGVSVSNFTTDRGLASREDSLGYSLSLTAPLAGGDFSIGAGLFDTDTDSEDAEFAVSYSKAIELLGQEVGATVSFSGLDSVFGDREEVAVGLTYGYSLFDASAAVWHELENDWFGVELGVSRSVGTPINDLVATPFLTVNLADEYTAVEAGIKAAYPITDQLSISAKLSYNNNDFDNSAFSVEDEWIIGAGLKFDF